MVTVYIYKRNGAKVTFPDVALEFNRILTTMSPHLTWKTFYLLAADLSTVSVVWEQIERITTWDANSDLLMEREVWNAKDSGVSVATTP